jgi:hypothetical protein
MNAKFILLAALAVTAISGCNKQNEEAAKSVAAKKQNDLVYVTNDAVSFGYYKSSIKKVDENVRVWLHLPDSNKKSEKEIERVSELLAEISCKLQQIRITKTTDAEGKELVFSGQDQKWETPSPPDDFYKVIVSVCSEVPN